MGALRRANVLQLKETVSRLQVYPRVSLFIIALDFFQCKINLVNSKFKAYLEKQK